MAPTVYLISGANRGIGLGLVTALAARPDVIIFAGARSPSSASALHALAAQYPGKVHPIQLTSSDRADNEAAVKEVDKVAGRLDVVIANAGIAKFFGKVLDTPEQEMRDHYEINVLGPLLLFQSTWPLLQHSPKPVFAIVSSAAGSIERGAVRPSGMLAYGASKAAVNFLAVKLWSEFKELVVLPISPGPVATDMGNYAKSSDPFMAKHMQLITVETSVGGIVKLLDAAGAAAERAEEPPRLINYDGAVVPW
ncbi:NAD(P)-binding protein [Calocera cornea HHB12733]|uniref:NAD(P)-binding protein n=1 Tax=Calocera cornea HHB12733 TaxID=1353952 RepID=A0A165E924_9BASI|nr:NAD(P)-binding protein [Calocera cornea HHB12733]